MKLSSRKTLNLLRDFESPNVTYIDPDGSWPIVWERARGVNVWDVDDKKYLDLTAAFGVAAAGHANPKVVGAAKRQMSQLLHGMGDVHPHALKALLAQELSKLTFGRWLKASGKKSRGRVIFTNSGFEAVEAALKTALLSTARTRVIAFEGAYHGLGYGALDVTHREHFRSPFRKQLGDFTTFVPFPKTANEAASTLEAITSLLASGEYGAILFEPIQGRAGIRVPPLTFWKDVSRIATKSGTLMIADEIFTGFGRTGAWFGCELFGVVPDLVCVGKALTGGFPLSACIGRAELMESAWPVSSGEAIHTSTYLGHPVGCAMALAQIDEVRRRKLPQHAAAVGSEALFYLQLRSAEVADISATVRGAGLMIALELTTLNGEPATDLALKVVKEMLRRGYILLPEGEFSNVLSLTPPLIISRKELFLSIDILIKVLVNILKRKKR